MEIVGGGQSLRLLIQVSVVIKRPLQLVQTSCSQFILPINSFPLMRRGASDQALVPKPSVNNTS